MATVDKGNAYAVPYFWGANTIGINIDKVKQALGSDKLPDNEWDLIFNPEYAKKLQNCGISILDSQYEVVPIAMHYAGKDPMSNNRADLDAAFNTLKKVRPFIKRFSSSGYIDDMARGDLCVVLGYGGDMHIAKRRAQEAKNGINLRVLAPKNGMGIWLDSLVIPKGAQNIEMAYAYINNTLDPKVAAANGDFVSFAPGSDAAKQYMKPEFVNDPSIFPTGEILSKSFMLVQKDPDTVKYSVRKWQELKTAK
jgi:putative spermidine/putrescine transport system substrate-binding protein/putrescine transport system substrate-binding protein